MTKLLLSVDWGVESEVAQVEGLLAEWARKAPIDAPDALKLLGRERTFQAEVVRRFAVDALRRADDAELLDFLLQLVQGLRYQTGGRAGRGASSGLDSNGGEGTGDRGIAVVAVAPTLGARSADDAAGSPTARDAGEAVSPLAQFLIDRACMSLKLANFFYWYLRVDLEDTSHGHVYRGVLEAFREAMGRSPGSARMWGELGRSTRCAGLAHRVV